MPKIIFQPSGIELEVRTGENLLRAAMEAGVHINASCGGQGACGKCLIRQVSGRLEGGRGQRLSAEEAEAGRRLACLSRVVEDVVVEIPVESQVDGKILELQKHKVNLKEWTESAGAVWLREQGMLDPLIQARHVELPPPDYGSNYSDLTRLLRALYPGPQTCQPEVDFDLIGDLPELMRKEDFEVTAFMAKRGQPQRGEKLIHVLPGNKVEENYGLALDIGTTTVFGRLLDMNSGRSLGEHGEYNNQISYGEDVLSRIVHAVKEGGLKTLQARVIENINSIAAHLAGESGVDPGAIHQVVAAGNTTMTQLLLGINPKYIRLSPFTPTATHYPAVKLRKLGIDLGRQARMVVCPSISSYVGGDIVAGVLASNLYQETPLTLFIDIGTNGEIVVGNQDWMACAACSAGPAFEGGGVEHGMRAAEGAIEDISINPVTGDPMIMTIGMTRPKGICGTGLINVAASLFEVGFIDGKGRFRTDLGNKRIRIGESGGEYVLAYADDTDIGRDIVITEVDLDNLIRAKGAMFAGYTALLEGVGLTLDSLDRILIGGGFGQYINLEKAITIGLFPELPADKFAFLGNSSLKGAEMVLLSNTMRRRAWHLISGITNFELSENPAYMDYYLGALFLPHTDQDKFPGVMAHNQVLRDALKSILYPYQGLTENDR